MIYKLSHVLIILGVQGYLYSRDRAIWFKSTIFGDDKDRVIRRSNGEFTYFALDIVYHSQKFTGRCK